NVVLNRVASDRFPDTIYDVVHQPGQYSWLGHTSLVPTERAYKNAKRLLSGERFCPPNVLFQAQFRQGSGVYASIYDSTLCTTTFFCYG
ncbi:MAG: cell wall hydrolase, partial [Oscillospiraceae bacterium]